MSTYQYGPDGSPVDEYVAAGVENHGRGRYAVIHRETHKRVSYHRNIDIADRAADRLNTAPDWSALIASISVGDYVSVRSGEWAGKWGHVACVYAEQRIAIRLGSTTNWQGEVVVGLLDLRFHETADEAQAAVRS